MSGSELKSGIREGYRTQKVKIDSEFGCFKVNAIVTLHSPTDLSAEERRKREDQVRISMLGLLDEKNNNEEAMTA